MKPIDEYSDLSLVRLAIIRSMKDGRRLEVSCIRHGAMNCIHVSETGNRFYRCLSSYKYNPDDLGLSEEQRRFIDRACEAACVIVKADYKL